MSKIAQQRDYQHLHYCLKPLSNRQTCKKMFFMEARQIEHFQKLYDKILQYELNKLSQKKITSTRNKQMLKALL